METAQFTKGLDTSIKGLTDLRKEVTATSSGLGREVTAATTAATRGLDTMGATVKRVFEIVAGVSIVGVIGMLKNLGEQAYQSGLQSMQAERAFRGMASAMNIDADPLLAKMESVSKGLADMSDIALASARGLQQGLSQTQIVKVLELATDRAKLAGKTVSQAYNEMSDAIAENNLRSLKQFGIVLDVDDVMKNYARTLGTFPEALSQAEKTQAIFNATMEAAAKQTRSATTAMDEHLDRIEKNSIRTKQFWSDVGTWIVNAHGDLLAFWQDFEKAADDFGRRKMGELNIGLSPGVSEGLAGGIGTSDIGRSGRSVPVPIPPEVIAAPDRLKRALAEADHTLKMLNATMAAGVTTSADYAAGLQVQIGKLQALGSALDEDGRLRLLGFQAALATINFTTLQQGLAASLQSAQALEAGLLSGVRESVAARISTEEQGAVGEAAIHVASLAQQRVILAQALTSANLTETQRFQFRQQLAALDSQFDQAKSAERIARMAQDTVAIKAEYATRASFTQTQLTADLAAIKNSLDQEVALYRGAFDDVVTATGMVGAAEVAAAEASFTAILASNTQLVADQAELRARGKIGQAEFYAFVADISAKNAAALLAIDAAKTKAQLDNLAAIAAAVKKEVDGEKAGWDQLAKDEAALILATGASQIITMKQVVDTYDRLIKQETAGSAIQEGLITAKYLTESKIRMARFLTDADIRKAGQIAEQEFYLKTLQDRNTAEARLAALALATWSEEQFAAGNYFTFLGSQYGLALGAGTDFYSSMKTLAGDAARASTTFLQDGFFALVNGDFKSLGDAAKSFGLAMERALLNFLASKAVNMFMGWLSSLFDGLSGGDLGGGIIGTVLTGAAALLGKFSSSSVGNAGGIGTSDIIRDTTGAVDNLTTSANGAASALNTVTNFSAGVSAALSALGVGLGIYSLAQGGSPMSMALSAGGTALSAYSLAVNISQILANQGIIAATSVLPTIGEALAAGLAAVAPELAASIGTALAGIVSPAIVAALGGMNAATAAALGIEAGATAASAISTAVASVLESITPFLDLLAGVGAGFAVFGVFLSAGFAGMAADAEDAAISFKEQAGAVQYAMNGAAKATAIFADLGTQLDSSHLVGTLHTLHDAMRDLGNLDLAAGLNQVFGDEGAEAITKAIPVMRATVGAAWLAALDAAFKQGLDLTPGGPDAANALGETLQSPFRAPRHAGGGFAALNAGQISSSPGSLGLTFDDLFGQDQKDDMRQLLDHILGTTWDLGQDHPDATHVFDDRTNTFQNPNAYGGRIGGIQDLPGQTVFSRDQYGVEQVNIDALNKFLDGEYLATTLRNAVVDVGALFGISAGQMGGIGAGEGNWRGTPFGGAAPSVATIAGVQEALKAAGFVPGEYAKALEAYLVSIDQDIVNNPLWKKFIDALHGTGDITQAVNAAIVASMTPLKFYDAAKGLTDALVTNIKAAMQSQAEMVASGADQKDIDAVGKLIEAMQAGIKAYAGLVQLYTGLPSEIAALTGNLQTQTAASVDAWKVAIKSLADAGVDAKKAFDEAITSGNVIAIQQAGQAFHDAAMTWYTAQVQAVQKIQAAMQSLLDNYARPLADMATAVAITALAAGNSDWLTGLLAGFATLATTGETASIRLFAIGAGLRAIIAALPTAVKGTADLPGLGANNPGAIPASIASAAAPFLTSLDSLIADALTGFVTSSGAIAGGDPARAPELLKQQAGAIQDLGAAAVSAVEQWRDQTIASYQAIADAMIKGVEARRDAELAANAAIENGLERQIALAQQWLSAVQGAESFVQSLLLGPGSPLNPAEQLALVKGQYEAAKAAALSSPEGLSRAVSAGQAYLSQLGKGQTAGQESPALKAAVAAVLADVQGFLGATGSSTGIASNISVMQAQLTALHDLDQTIKDAADLEIQAIKGKLDDAILAVQAAAKKIVDDINAGVAAALELNTTRQLTLLADLFNSNQDQLKAITGGLPVQYFLAQQAKAAADALTIMTGQLAVFLASVVPTTASSAPAPGAPERVEGSFATGTPFVPRTGLYQLHRGERVTPAGQNRGTQTLVIEELRVPVHIDGQPLTETVLKNVRVKYKAGGRGFIPKGAIGS